MRMRRSRPTGFTLIELLVVVAIIAILAAILIPVLAAAKNNAKSATCQNHIKGLGMAILMYADDWNGYLCPLNGYNKSLRAVSDKPNPNDDPSTGSLWKYYKNRNLLFCPGDKERMRKDVKGMNMWSYTLNGFCTYTCHSSHGDIAKARSESNTRGVPLSVFTKLSRTISLVEENTYEGDYQDTAMAVNDMLFIWYDYTTNRHSGKANVSFLDGHVGRVPGYSNWRKAKWPDGTYMFHNGTNDYQYG